MSWKFNLTQKLSSLQPVCVLSKSPYVIEIEGKKFQLLDLSESHELNQNIDIFLREDWYIRNVDLLISRIQAILKKNQSKDYARDCHVQPIQEIEAKLFLEENHLMGFGKGKIHLGIYKGIHLVGVGSFSNPLYMKNENPPYSSIELIRYATLSNRTLTGGLSLLIKSIEKQKDIDDIITYIDKEWSNGKSFKKSGFKPIMDTPPIGFNFKNNSRVPTQTNAQFENLGNVKMRYLINKNLDL